jgi:hypothetical protein
MFRGMSTRKHTSGMPAERRGRERERERGRERCLLLLFAICLFKTV